jgi:hypothetical protein
MFRRTCDQGIIYKQSYRPWNTNHILGDSTDLLLKTGEEDRQDMLSVIIDSARLSSHRP